jgi:hypothetical protein
LDNAVKDNGARATERLNYFNYFTEIEEEFVRRRGKPLLISPMEWALVESWKSAGIPLHVVLRAINQAFDAYESRPRRFRRVNSVFYCQQEVEATYAEYCHAQVGASAPDTITVDTIEEESKSRKKKKSSSKATVEPFPKELLVDFFSRSKTELQSASLIAAQANQAELHNAIERAIARLKEISAALESAARVSAEAIERDLDAIDRIMLEGATKSISESKMKKIRAEAESQLESYRKKMDKAIYDQTIQNFVSRRLRETANLPRLSLFYL